MGDTTAAVKVARELALTPFVELTVRVPLTEHLSPGEGQTHQEVLMDILEEGLSTYVYDEVDSPETRCVLRLRAGGVDKLYPLRFANGQTEAVGS